jgi:hypothetical protein
MQGRIWFASGTSRAPGRFARMENKPHETPSDVTAEEGEVQVDGPNGVAVSFTPDAAVETSDRLFRGAAEAKGQKARRESGTKGSDAA